MTPTSAADVVVVGAGPAGVATALTLADAGRDVEVLDGARFPRDKTCGEGLLPSGVAALSRLNLLDDVLDSGARILKGVTYRVVRGDDEVRVAFPTAPGGNHTNGLGVRRLHFDEVLVDALRRHPRVVFREGTRATGVARCRSGAIRGVSTADGEVTARIVVAADGLHSLLRRSAGWRIHRARPRYGLAGHWRGDAGRLDGVTVVLADDHEWYRAPVGPSEVLVSVLGSASKIRHFARTYAAEASTAFPELASHQLEAPPRAAGGFDQRPQRTAGNGLFLVGDAAGYRDPTTGEGIGLALHLGETLGAILASAGPSDDALHAAERAYSRRHRQLVRDRNRVTAIARFMAAHPTVTTRALRRLRERPEALSVLVGINCGYWGFGRLSVRDWLSLAGL